MDFISHVNNIRKRGNEEIAKIAQVTMTSQSTVYKWLNRTVAVPPLKQKAIADYYGKTVEELFP